MWSAVMQLVGDQDQTATHSMRRLLLFCRPDKPVLVLDGQQRLTSTTLMFASLRDAAAKHGLMAQAQALATLVDGSGNPSCQILQPTLDDRAVYTEAVASSSDRADTEPSSAIARCRAYFDAKASQVAETGMLPACCAAAMNRLQFLHFPVENGTALQKIFESAATRDKAMAAHRVRLARDYCEDEDLDSVGSLDDAAVLRLWTDAHPTKRIDVAGVRMSPVDLLRNFVHEHVRLIPK
eukprot:SAG31_NODE_1066_length_10091_cov_5.779323_7_plen_238_part_00